MSRTRRAEKRRGGFLGKAVALLLGFILGIVGTIGGIVGGGYYVVSSVKIKDAVNGVAGATGMEIDYSQYITEEYAEQTVLGLIGSLGTVATEFQNGTGSLSTLEKISPFVRTAVQQLADTTANYGVPIDVETLMSTPFPQLSTFAQQTINSVELGKVIETATGNTSGMITLLCYGEQGVHYTVDDEGKIQMLGTNKPLTVGALTTDDGLNGVLNNISLAGLMTSVGSVDTSDAIMRALLYGTKGVDYEEVNGTVEMKPVFFLYDANSDCFIDDSQNLYAKTAEGYLGEDGTLIKTNEVSTASTEGENEYDYTVYDKNGKVVYELKTDGEKFIAYKNGVAQKHRGLTLGDLMGGKDLTSIFETLVLGDFIAPNPNDANAIQLAISYGEKDVHFTVLPDNTVKMLPMQIAVLDGNAYDVYGAKLNAEVANSVTNPPNVDGYVVTLKDGGRYYLPKDATVDDEDGYQKTIKVDGGEALLFYAVNATTGAPEYYSAHTIGSFLTGNIFNDMLNALTIGDIMGGDVTKEQSPLLYAVKDWKISSFKDGDMINGLKLGDVITVGENAPAALKTISQWTIGELTSSEKFNSLRIGDLIEVTETSPAIVKTIAEWTLADMQTTAKFDSLKIGELIEVGADAPAVLKTLSNWTIADMKSTAKFDTLKIGELIEVTETSPAIVKTIAEWTLADMKSTAKFDTLKIGELIEVSESSPAILKTLADWTLADMKSTNKFDTLKIGELIEVSETSPAILKTLADWTIADMKSTDKFDTIKINELIEIDMDDPDTSSVIKTISTWTIGELKQQDKFDDLYIKDLMNVDVNSADTPAIMKAIAEWQLKDLKDKTKFDTLKINQLIEVTNDSPAILKKIGTWTIGEMQSQDKINSLQISDLFTVTATSPTILHAISSWTLGELQTEEKFNTLQIGQIVKVDASSPAILQAIKTWTLGDMQDQTKFDSLKISDIFEVTDTSPTILQAIETWTLGDMKNQTKFDSLKIGDIFEVTTSSPAILQAIQGWTLGDMQKQEKFDTLQINQIFKVDSSSPAILQAIATWTLADMQDQTKFDGLKISQIFTVDTSSPAILQAIKDWTLADMQDQTKFDGLEVGKLFNVTDSSPAILQAIKTWTLGDMQKQEKFDTLQIKQLIEVPASAPPILKAIENWTLKDLSDQTMFDKLYIRELVTIDEDNAPNILLAIKDWTLKDLTSQDKFDNLTLKQVLGADEVEKSKYFRTIGDTPISELSTAIEGLRLTDIFGTDIFRTIIINGVEYYSYTDLDEQGYEVLYRLYDRTEDGVQKFYLEPTYQTQVEILETHIRHMPTFVNGEGEIQLLYYDQDEGIYYLDHEHNTASGFAKGDSAVTYYYFTSQHRLYEKRNAETNEIEYFEDEACTVLSDREAEGIWHYMLMDSEGKLNTHPTLGDMDAMVDNMQHNIRNATLNELEEDGIIKFADGEEAITGYHIKKHIELKMSLGSLVFDIGDNTSSYYDKTYIGELTVMEMLEYIADVFAAIDKMESQTHSI